MRLLGRLRRILNPPRPEPFVKRTLESGMWKDVFDPPPHGWGGTILTDDGEPAFLSLLTDKERQAIREARLMWVPVDGSYPPDPEEGPWS